MKDAWQSLTRRERLAGAAFVLAFVGILLLAILGSLDALDSAWAALITVISGLFQLAGASMLHREGRADPALARSAVGRLLSMARRAAEAERLAQDSFESGTASDRRDALGLVSVHLSYLQEQSLQAVDAWHDFHEEAVRELLTEDDNDHDG